MRKLWDNHMHTSFSGDCSVPPEEMLASAMKNPILQGITFTDHLDIDYKEEPGLFDLDISAYQKNIASLQNKYHSTTFELLFGIELGLQPHLAQTHAEILATTPFDYVIGSSHVVDGVDPYYPTYFENQTPQEGYKKYYESILNNLQAFDQIDAYGHLDYIFRYGPDFQPNIDTHSSYAEIIDAILEILIKKEIALEINTGAFRCGLLQPNPSTSIISRYYELGGKKITLGADAHKPEHIALAFSKVHQILIEIGFKEYCVYKQRNAIWYPL